MGDIGRAGGLRRGGEIVGEKPTFGRTSALVPSNSFNYGSEANRCGICSTAVLNRGVLDCCTHWFCFACIDQWSLVTNLCPLCKARFRFITCLPVGYGDQNGRQGPDNVGIGFAKRVDGPTEESSSFPFSFPSYFIDEEAVLCLDGDACRVRAGLLSPEVEGEIAADTSVACDVCDCWYHAGCVDFDPEESSFYCPRCVGSREQAETLHPMPQSWTHISPEERASSLIGSLPAEKELSYGGGTLLGSTSVAIAVAEEGESAVSISMRRIPVQGNSTAAPTPTPTPNPNPTATSSARAAENRRVMWSPIREPVSLSRPPAPIWSPIREPASTSREFELWSPTPGPAERDDTYEQLWSPTPESESVAPVPLKEPPSPPSLPSSSTDRLDPHSDLEHIDTSIARTSSASGTVEAGRSFSKSPASTKAGGEEPNSCAPAPPTPKTWRGPEDPTKIGGVTKTDEEKLADAVSLQIVAELPKAAKRRGLPDRERIDVDELPEPPRKVARKSTKRGDNSLDRSLTISKSSRSKTVAEEDGNDHVNDYTGRASNSITTCIDEDQATVSKDKKGATEQLNDLEQDPVIPESEQNDAPALESNPEVDLMDIVSDPSYRPLKEKADGPGKGNGVRTRIIMHRETDGREKEGAGLIGRIRQQMRDDAGPDGGDVQVSDDRFIAAFKAAVARSREKDVEPKTGAVSRQGKFPWLSKMMNQGGGSRSSLTRKLYAGGTGRWDRDWDIAFWKKRSANLEKAPKEAEEKVSGSRTTEAQRKAEGSPSKTQKDPIFSRLYIADNSLLPRGDDMQPLSAKESTSAQNSAMLSAKGAPGQSAMLRQSEDSTSLAAILGSMATTKSTPSGVYDLLKSGSGQKLGSKAIGTTKAPSKASITSKTPESESGASNADVRKQDKRQWALDVLARKTGTSAGGGPGAAATANKDSQFIFLLQLPVGMRPLLPYDRRSKVPTAVRQVQLNRFVEQELKWANLPAIQDSPECEEAVNRAKAREEELYKRSNSKGVYVNLCVRSLTQTDAACAAKEKQDREAELSGVIQRALLATGLVDSPPASPPNDQDDHPKASVSNEAVKDSSPKSKPSSEQTPVEDILKMGNSDIFHDFKFEPEEKPKSLLPLNPCTSKLGSATVVEDPDHGSNKSTAFSAALPNGPPELAKSRHGTALEVHQLGHERAKDVPGALGDPSQTSEVPIRQVGTFPEDGGADGADLHDRGAEASIPNVSKDATVKSDNLTSSDSSAFPLKEKLLAAPADGECAKASGGSCEEKERNAQGFITGTTSITTFEGHEQQEGIEGSTDRVEPQFLAKVADKISDDWMDSGKFADLDRRIEDIRRITDSPSAERELDVPWSTSRASKVAVSKEGDPNNGHHSVQKQVEIFVNQHLKPLYRSGVITADQFRYAVSKTAAKVMEHHENAPSADFLIAEGNKVRKLADQYLQAFSKRKAR